MAARNTLKIMPQIFYKHLGRNFTRTSSSLAIVQERSGRHQFSHNLITVRYMSNGSKNKTVPSPHPDLDLRHGVSLSEFVLEYFPKYGDAVALVNGITGETFTYNQLLDKIMKVSSSLLRRGIKQGDVVTLFSPNCPEFAILSLAVAHIGAVMSPLNPLYTPGELTHALSHSKAQLIATVDDLVPVVREALKNCPNVKGIITFGHSVGCIPFESMMGDDGSLCPKSVDINDKDDLCQLPYSSGTTGLPKGVMLPHFSIVVNLQQILSNHVMDYKSQGDTLIGVLPFFHIYGGVITLLAGLRHGVKIVTLPKFEPTTFLGTVQDHRGSFVHIVPPIVLFLAKHELVPKFDLSSVHTFFTAAAPVGQEMMNAVTERLNNPALKFRQGYGLTEMSPLTHTTPMGSTKLSSIGVPVPNQITKVIDIETGDTLGPGKEGEICVAGPNIMKGYYDNPKATADTVKDGWLHTGDIGYYDDEAHYYVTDRLKELIKVKGFQVAPAELEALINTHPAIADVAVVGVPDERAGELPRAFCVLKNGMEASEDDVQRFVKDKTAPYKQLAGGVEFRGTIPKTASGKIQRRILKAEFLDRNK